RGAQQKIRLRGVKGMRTMVFRSKTGPTKGKEPENWSIKFRPLWQLDELQQADVRLKQAQADDIYLRRGVAQPADIATSRFGGDTYSVETHLTAPAPQPSTSEPPGSKEPDPEAPQGTLAKAQSLQERTS